MAKSLMMVMWAMVAAVTVSNCSASVIPAAYSIPYASSYNAHVINHAVAAPVAPIVAARAVVAPPLAPIVATRAVVPPLLGAPLPYSTLLG